MQKFIKLLSCLKDCHGIWRFVTSRQCNQIGLFFTKFSYTKIPIKWRFSDVLKKSHYVVKTASAIFWTTFEKIGLIYIPKSGCTVRRVLDKWNYFVMLRLLLGE